MNVIWDVLELYIVRREYFAVLLGEHIYMSSIAIGNAIVLGVLVGTLASAKPRLGRILMVIANIGYTIPVIAFFGIMVSISGIGLRTTLIALTMYGLLPVIRNTYSGIMQTDQDILEAAAVGGAGKWTILLRISLPIAVPFIIAGIRTMVVMTISMAAVAAFIGAGGLGSAIWRGITTYNSIMTLAGSILVAVLAIGADWCLGKLETVTSRIIFG